MEPVEEPVITTNVIIVIIVICFLIAANSLVYRAAAPPRSVRGNRYHDGASVFISRVLARISAVESTAAPSIVVRISSVSRQRHAATVAFARSSSLRTAAAAVPCRRRRPSTGWPACHSSKKSISRWVPTSARFFGFFHVTVEFHYHAPPVNDDFPDKRSFYLGPGPGGEFSNQSLLVVTLQWKEQRNFC